MATPISRASTPRQLVEGLNAVLGVSYNSVDNQHSVLFEQGTSDKYYEEEVFMTGFGLAPTKGEGGSIFYDTASETYTSRYEHETVGMGFQVTEEQTEDNIHLDVAKKLAMLVGRSMAATKQQKAANVFNNGFTAGFAGGDGAPLFSNAHPTIGDGNQSNTFAVDISETALENMAIAIETMKDDRGILIGARARSLHLPPQLEYTAYRILEADKQSGNNFNDPNALKATGRFPGGVYINHRFTDSDAFFIKTDVPESTKYFVRKPLASKTDGDFDTGNMKYKARERYSFGWSDWRGWIGSQGA